jgi:hypothetical protein
MSQRESVPIPNAGWSEIEIYRIVFDYLKNLTTICTGSTLLIVAFLEKLFTKPFWKFGVGLALVCFIMSVILCAISQALIIEMASEREDKNHVDRVKNWTMSLLIIALVGFVIGIISLAIFGLINLFSEKC